MFIYICQYSHITKKIHLVLFYKKLWKSILVINDNGFFYDIKIMVTSLILPVFPGTCLIRSIFTFARATWIRMRTFVRSVLEFCLRFTLRAPYALYNLLNASLILFVNARIYTAAHMLFEFSEIVKLIKAAYYLSGIKYS